MDEWWHANAGQRQGPVSEDVLKRQLQHGEISRDTLVWREGMPDWIALRSAPALEHLLRVLPPPIPVQQPPLPVTAPVSETPDCPAAIVDTEGVEPPTAPAAPAKRAAPVVRPAGVWIRFFARLFDLWWSTLLATGLFLLAARTAPGAFAGWLDKPGGLVAVTVLMLPAALLLDAVVHGACGNTPGKALLGVQVLAGARRLGFARYLGRNLNLWSSGLCFGIPFLSMLSMYYQSRRVRQSRPASYDTVGNQVMQRRPGAFKLLAFVLLFGVLLLVHLMLNMVADLVVRRQQIAPTAPVAGRDAPVPSTEPAAPGQRVVPLEVAEAPVQTTRCRARYYQGKAPVINNRRLAAATTALCFRGTDGIHSGVTRTMLWQAEQVTSESLELADNLDFNPEIHEEERLPEGMRNGEDDYERTRYQTALLVPPNRLARVDARIDSMSWANAVPLAGNDLPKRWLDLGNRTAARARNGGRVFMLSGVLFEGDRLVQLNGRVLVPTALYIAFYDARAHSTGAYVLPNRAGAAIERLSLLELEQRSDITLFPTLPQAVKSARLMEMQP